MGDGVCRVLVVEDVPDLLDVVTTYLYAAGFDVVGCGSARSALAALDAGDFDVALVDHQLAGDDGAALVSAMRAQAPELPVAVMSGTVTAPAGCTGTFVPKPFHLRDLACTLRHLAEPQPSSSYDEKAMATPPLPVA